MGRGAFDYFGVVFFLRFGANERMAFLYPYWFGISRCCIDYLGHGEGEKKTTKATEGELA
jgi:hypothetical protein